MFTKGNFYYKVEVNKYLIVDIQYIKLFKEFENGKFRYKVIEQTINHDYEIPITEEERLKKKYGSFNYHDERQIGKYVGGECKFDDNDLVEFLTDEYIKNKVEEKKDELKKIKDDILKCPITGGNLICLGSDLGVMDGAIHWIVEGHENIRWETSSRWNSQIFSGNGYYKWYSDKKEWIEQVKCEDGWKFIDKPQTSEEEENLRLINKAYSAKKKLNIESGKSFVKLNSLLTNSIQVFSKTFNNELVKVQSMSPPSGLLNYIDLNNNDDYWKED